MALAQAMWAGLQLASMDIMATHLMPARPTDITALIGLWAGYSSVPALGMAGAAAGADGGVVGATAAGVMDAAGVTDVAAGVTAAVSTAAAVGPAAAVTWVASMAAASMVEVVSTVAGVVSTVVVAGMAAEADTAKRRAPILLAVMRTRLAANAASRSLLLQRTFRLPSVTRRFPRGPAFAARGELQ